MAPKEEPVKVDTRLISGRGIITIPKDTSVRLWYLYVNLVRDPVVNFDSSKINPSKSEYAKFTWCRGDYVLRENTLNFEHQLYTWEADPIGYVPPYLACVFEGINGKLDYIIALSGGLPPTPGEPIYCQALDNYPTVVKFVCRLNAAIEVELWRYRYDVACPDGVNNPPPPPDPPPPPKTPSNIPIGNISPPYESPNDGGDSIPYEGDEAPDPDPPTEGDECIQYVVTWTADYYSTETEFETLTQTLNVYAPTSRPYIVASPPGFNPIQQIAIYSKGIIELNQPCGESAVAVVTNFNTPGGIQNLVVDVFEPVP